MQNKNQTIQQLIQQTYDQNNQYLDLYCQSQYWSDVLLGENWEMLKEIQLGNDWEYIANCGIDDETIISFINLKWPNLQQLYLNDNKLTYKGMQLMLDCKLTNLKKLSLRNNLIGNKGVKQLVKADLPNLQILWIQQCQIGSEGIKHLTKARWLNLDQLYLGNNQSANQNKMQLSGAESIVQCKFRQLKKIYLVQKSSICWMSYILMEKQDVEFNRSGIKIKNEQLRLILEGILKNFNVLQFQEEQ